MFRIHQTSGGKKLLVAQMSNEHLTNTINMLLQKLEGVNKLLDGGGELQMSPSMMAALGVRKSKLDFDKLAKEQKSIMGKLYPYLAEAFLRDLDRGYTQQVMGRKDRLVLPDEVSQFGLDFVTEGSQKRLADEHFDLDEHYRRELRNIEDLTQ